MEHNPDPMTPADWEPPMSIEADVLALLAQSEAEAEAGLFVSGDDILRELWESIARMEGDGAATRCSDVEASPNH